MLEHRDTPRVLGDDVRRVVLIRAPFGAGMPSVALCRRYLRQHHLFGSAHRDPLGPHALDQRSRRGPGAELEKGRGGWQRRQRWHQHRCPRRHHCRRGRLSRPGGGGGGHEGERGQK